MHPGEHVDFLVFLVEQLLQLAHLRLQRAHSLFQGLGVSSGKGATAKLIARLTLKAHVGALCAAGANAVTADLLGAAAIACLSDAGLAIRADLDHLHGQDSRHCCGSGRF